MTEKTLRHGALSAFGLLFLLSYALTLVVGMLMSAPIDHFRAYGTLPEGFLVLSALLAVLGTLMLLSVFHKKLFYVLSAVVVLGQLATLVSTFMSVETIFSLFARGNMISILLFDFTHGFGFPGYAMQLLPVIDCVLWLLPFALYYLLRIVFGKRFCEAESLPEYDHNKTTESERPLS